MEAAKILLMSASKKSREALPEALREHQPHLAVEVAGRMTEALEKVAAGRFDAAIFCADTPDELAYLIRIKKRNPDLPVVLLSRVTEAGFGPLAESFGAAAVVRKTSGLKETAKALATALETHALLRAQKPLIARSKELGREIRALTKENLKLVEMALGLTAAEESTFCILLVEDDPLQARFVIRSFARANLPSFVRTVDNVDEAIAYLSGTGVYSDRGSYPFPALIISDLNMPLKSGLEFLEWVRSRPETRNTGFIMMTSSDFEGDIDEAYRRGANLYLLKQDRPAEIVEVVRTILAQFNARKAGLGPV